VLSERYGENFIAQLIESQDGANKAIAAEVEGRAVGLLALSSEIDVATLQSSFDLDAFDGLVTGDPAQLILAAAARAKADAAEAEAETARRAVPADMGLPIEEGEEANENVAGEVARRDDARRRALAVANAAAAAAAAAAAEAAEAEARVSYTCDAVAISLFCVDEAFESRSRDFLPGIFAAYPDKKYALLTLPHTTPEFPLLSALQQVEPRSASAFDHVLYLYHRDALLSPALKLRPAVAGDAAAVETLTAGFVNAAEIAEMFADATGPFKEQPKLAFVAECSEQVRLDLSVGLRTKKKLTTALPSASRGRCAYAGIVCGCAQRLIALPPGGYPPSAFDVPPLSPLVFRWSVFCFSTRSLK
jgi:hypothetical protein